MGDFIGHAGGGGGRKDRGDFSSLVACFFEGFAGGAVGEGFGGVFCFVADETGANFDHAGLDGAAVLLDEDIFVVLGEGKDADDSGGIGSSGVFPIVDFTEGHIAGPWWSKRSDMTGLNLFG